MFQLGWRFHNPFLTRSEFFHVQCLITGRRYVVLGKACVTVRVHKDSGRRGISHSGTVTSIIFGNVQIFDLTGHGYSVRLRGCIVFLLRLLFLVLSNCDSLGAVGGEFCAAEASHSGVLLRRLLIQLHLLRPRV